VVLFGIAGGVPARALDLARAGVCTEEGRRLVGVVPVQVGKKTPLPKKIRNVDPEYPKLTTGTTGSGPWVGEVLLDVYGKVVHVWTIREVRLNPPFPTFNQAIIDAIRKWEFEPLVVNGRRTPACTTVTISIDWS